MKVNVSILLTGSLLIFGNAFAWTQLDPHMPYSVKGKSYRQIYELAQGFKKDYRKFDNEDVVKKEGPIPNCIYVYVDGEEKFRDFGVNGKYERYERYLENSLLNFNAAASLLECAAECDDEDSGSAWLELGDLWMSNPKKIKISDPYNRALAAYSKAGDAGFERGYLECAKIWLIPDGSSEEERKTMASKFYRKAMRLSLKQGRKTDAYIYVDRVRNLGYPSLSEALLEEIRQHKASNE